MRVLNEFRETTVSQYFSVCDKSSATISRSKSYAFTFQKLCFWTSKGGKTHSKRWPFTSRKCLFVPVLLQKCLFIRWFLVFQKLKTAFHFPRITKILAEKTGIKSWQFAFQWTYNYVRDDQENREQREGTFVRKIKRKTSFLFVFRSLNRTFAPNMPITNHLSIH